jgi:putative endonuclease
MMNRSYCIYMMTNKYNTTIYTGVTSNLMGRVGQHRDGEIKGFTQKYNLHKLVYYEVYEDVQSAILREKQIKSWKRIKKIDLVNTMNPEWKDLYSELTDSEII